MKFTKVLVLLLVLGLIAAACGDGADETTTTEPMAEVGSAELPINVVFVPSVSAEDIITGGALLDDVLTATTGLEF
jgi:ABC-type phosphate/phosphonate transport system substrate-binding protein